MVVEFITNSTQNNQTLTKAHYSLAPTLATRLNCAIKITMINDYNYCNNSGQALHEAHEKDECSVCRAK